MKIILVGLNYRMAPVEVRERLACDNTLVLQALSQFADTYTGCEFVLLSTCNRVECYAAVSKTTGPTAVEIAKWMADFRCAEFLEIEKYFYMKTDEDAVRHLFMVTASLDSMVIGESQITSQVKESYRIAHNANSTGKILNRLFHQAFRTNKEIIKNTSISSRRVSVAGVAVDLAKKLFADIQSVKVLIAGAGQMGQLLLEHFKHEKCRDITIVNRSRLRGLKYDVVIKPWEMLDYEIVQADIVIGAASAHEGYLFGKKQIECLMPLRGRRPLLIVDITVPRSFDPEIRDIENVRLYSIDDLVDIARDNIKLREGDMEKAVEIICGAASEFMDWFARREVGPVIGQIKEAFEKICQSELERFRWHEMPDGRRAELNSSIERVINRVCHCVVKNVDSLWAEQGAYEAEKFAQTVLADAMQIIAEDKKNAG